MADTPEQCEICAETLEAMFPKVRDPQTGEVFSISRCLKCGLGHTYPQPGDLSPYYGPKYHGGRHGMTERLCVGRRLRFVSAVAQPGLLLDFGCGDGGFLEAASRLGWSVAGVEMQPSHARARGLRVEERIEETAGRFDLVTLWHSLEHVRSPRTVMQSIAERLSADGTVIVAVPNLDSLQARAFRQNWFHLDVPRHLFHFTPLALERLFARCGLHIVRRWNLEFELDLFGWTQGALNRVMPHPNVLFDTLTSRGNSHKPWEVGASFILGAGVTVAAAPAVLLSAAMAKGAVAIVAARKPGHTASARP